MNDSPVGCQSRRTDRSIFSAEKMQDRWFKSFSRNQTNPQGRLPTAVFGDFSFAKKSQNRAISLLTHTGFFTEQQRGRFGLRCYCLRFIFKNRITIHCYPCPGDIRMEKIVFLFFNTKASDDISRNLLRRNRKRKTKFTVDDLFRSFQGVVIR